MTEPLLVQREIHIAAPPATVFAFLTDPEKIVGWMGAEATMEAQPGGLYQQRRVNRPGAKSPSVRLLRPRCRLPAKRVIHRSPLGRTNVPAEGQIPPFRTLEDAPCFH